MSNLKPTRLVRHVTEIDLEWLKERGIKAVLSDVDNTVVGWHSEDVPEEILRWVEGLQGAGIGLCLVSNTRNPKRLERLAARFGVKYVPGNAGKPGAAGYRKALELLGASASESVMVGDQLFTDVYGASKLGMRTILVNPLTSREFIGTKVVSRSLEKFVLRGDRSRP